MDKEYKISVAQNVERLTKVASNIEATNPEISSELDSLNENYLSIMKEAQYVGVQGYALRNRRCFDNCLRQKRASSDKPYDELWAECHEEYLNSINDDSYEKWNKYASKEDQSLPNLQRELVKTADRLLDLSDQVSDPKDSEELIAVANEMIKEAQLGQWLGKQVGNLAGKLSPSIRNIRRQLEQLQNQLSAAAGQATTPEAAQKVKAGVLRGLQRYVKDFTTNPDYRSIVHPRAKAAIQQISQSLGQMQGQVQSADAASLASILNQAAQTTGQLVDFAHKGIEIPAGEDKDKDGSPDIVDPDGGTKPSPATGATGTADSDGDGVPAATDPDKDGDGVPDPTGADTSTVETQLAQLFTKAKNYISRVPKDPSFIQAVASAMLSSGMVSDEKVAQAHAAKLMGVTPTATSPEAASAAGAGAAAGEIGLGDSGVSMAPPTPMPGSGEVVLSSSRKRIY